MNSTASPLLVLLGSSPAICGNGDPKPVAEAPALPDAIHPAALIFPPMDDANYQALTNPNDLKRRKVILLRSIGQQVELKRAALSPRDPLRGRSGRLLEVNRTRCLIGFPTDRLEDGEPVLDRWRIPVSMVLLPGSVEPAVGQRELFEEEGHADG